MNSLLEFQLKYNKKKLKLFKQDNKMVQLFIPVHMTLKLKKVKNFQHINMLQKEENMIQTRTKELFISILIIMHLKQKMAEVELFRNNHLTILYSILKIYIFIHNIQIKLDLLEILHIEKIIFVGTLPISSERDITVKFLNVIDLIKEKG